MVPAIQRTSNKSFFEDVPALAGAFNVPFDKPHKPRLGPAHRDALTLPHARRPHTQRRKRRLSPWDLAGPSIIVLRRGEPETRSDAPSKSPRVRETVRQDHVREYAVTYDDELVRREAGESREGRAGAGVGRLERSVEQNGGAQVIGD